MIVPLIKIAPIGLNISGLSFLLGSTVYVWSYIVLERVYFLALILPLTRIPSPLSVEVMSPFTYKACSFAVIDLTEIPLPLSAKTLPSI